MLGELTTTTFKHAVTRQRPLAGLIHHSDRGSQYAADAFQQCLTGCGVTPSMSRKGNPYDNALAESFADSIPPTKPAVAALFGVSLMHTIRAIITTPGNGSGQNGGFQHGQIDNTANSKRDSMRETATKK